MTDPWIVTLGLCAGTFSARLGGILLGQRLPTGGAWARALNALPGTLIVALVAGQLFQGGLNEWIAGALAAAVAFTTRSLVLTMAVGIATVYVLRTYT